jgi:hypothetical protein
MSEFVTLLFNFDLNPLFATFIQCSISPIINTAKSYACDCGDVKAPAGTVCYQTEDMTNTAASMRMLGGSAKPLAKTQFSVKANNETAGTSTSINIPMAIDKIIPLSDNSTNKTQNSITEFFHELNPLQSSLGKIVSDGLKLSTKAQGVGKFDVCLSNTKPNTDLLGFPVPGLATKEGSKYVRLATQVTNTDTSKKVCSKVAANTPVFMAFFQKSSVNMGVSSIISMVAVVVAVVAYAF